MDMKERLQELAEAARKRIEESDGPDKLNEVKVAYLGKKGELTAILKSMKDVAPEDRPKVGQMVNETRAKIEEHLEATRKKLEEEAKKLGKLDENKEFFQEKAVNSLLYSIAVSYGESNPMEKSFELIRELTQQKSAVIIGRCSGAIYANDPEATTVFLHADKDCRIKRVMERDGINEKKAAKLIKEVDEKRASFHKFCTGKEWEDASQYQLSIDTGKLDISDAANMIINYINAKNIRQKHL